MAGDQVTLRIEQEHIDVHMLGGNWKWDPDWAFVDAAGHHHWARGEPVTFPTLIHIVDSVWYADDGDGRLDEMVESHLACSLCYQPIEPGRVSAPSFIVGMQRFYIDDFEVTEAAAREAFPQAFAQ